MNDTMNSERNFHSSQLKDTWSRLNQKEANKRSRVLQIYLLHCITCHHYIKQCHCGSISQFGSCFLGSDCEFDKRDLSKSINEHPDDSE